MVVSPQTGSWVTSRNEFLVLSPNWSLVLSHQSSSLGEAHPVPSRPHPIVERWRELYKNFNTFTTCRNILDVFPVTSTVCTQDYWTLSSVWFYENKTEHFLHRIYSSSGEEVDWHMGP
jgi:hypothetical protein